ncbi:MAG: tetratricopeptide repeat protein [Thermoguttaceae bacterium]
MKSERRHDLSENSLAKCIWNFWTKISPYQNQIYWGIVAVLAAICIFLIFSRISASYSANAWNNYLTALNSGDVEKLEELTNNYKSGEVATRIRLSIGEILLEEGCNLAITKKEGAVEKLEKALENIVKAQSLAGSVSSDTQLAQQAAYDLAQTYEALATFRKGKDDKENAIKEFEQIVSKWKNGVYTQSAEKHLAYLKNPATERFFNYYENYVPSAETNKTPSFSTLGSGNLSPEDFAGVLEDMLKNQQQENDELNPELPLTLPEEPQQSTEEATAKPTTETE